MRYLTSSFLCLAFVISLAACSSDIVPSQAVVIRVGDRSITVAGLERIVKVVSLENGIPEKAVWSSIDSLVDRLVDDCLILEYGREKGITLSEIELERSLQDLVKDYPDNSFEETLLNKCIDFDEWKERLREQLLIKRIVRERIESLAPMSHHAIRSYYEERKEDFWHPSRAEYMHIVSKSRSEAEALLARLRAGEDMAELVKEQSIYSGLEGDYSRNWATKDMLPPPLDDILFSIPIGQVSDIIKTPYGFHIIKVLRREPKGRKGLLEVMGEIEERLLGEAIERHYKVWLTQLRERYNVRINYAVLDKARTVNEGT